jgi:cytochrome c-type biogenesis protein
MFGEVNISFWIAFGAGFVSFISPCVLPLIPGYLSFISGVSIDDLKDRAARIRNLKRVAVSSAVFVLGFSSVFILLGATATSVGQVLRDYLNIFNKIAGVLIIIFGLHFMGIFRIKFLLYEKRFHYAQKSLGLLSIFVIGLAFAFGWTPCIGPILGTVLGIAANEDTVFKGMWLLTGYSLGLGIPFFFAALVFNTFLGVFGFIKRHFRTIEIISGLFLVIVGVLIFTNSLQRLASAFLEWFPSLGEIG